MSVSSSSRRWLVGLVCALLVTPLLYFAATPTATKAKPAMAGTAGGKDPMVYVRTIDKQGNLTPAAVVPKVVRTEAEWHKRLTPEQFNITRNKATEPAFCGGLLKNH